MKIQLINVSVMDSLKSDLTSLAKKFGTEIEFEDTVGYKDAVLMNTSLINEAFKVAKVHTEVCRLPHSYFVRDIASGIVNSTHDVIENSGMRVSRDLIKYTEHDIEKVVRVALEVSKTKNVLVITKPEVLITSQFWQRVAAEVAVDYGASVECIEPAEFVLGYNIYTEKYGVIIADSLMGDMLLPFLIALQLVKNTSYVGDMESFYTTDGSLNNTALAIYEIIKEKYPEFAEYTKDYFDKFAN